MNLIQVGERLELLRITTVSNEISYTLFYSKGKVLIRKNSHSLSRLQTPNLTPYGKLSASASMLDVRQAGTDMNATEWYPQEFTDLHPNFQRKAIKNATKANGSIANCKQSSDRFKGQDQNTFSGKKYLLHAQSFSIILIQCS